MIAEYFKISVVIRLPLGAPSECLYKPASLFFFLIKKRIFSAAVFRSVIFCDAIIASAFLHKSDSTEFVQFGHYSVWFGKFQ